VDPFDTGKWTSRLAACVEFELLHWRTRLQFDQIRSLAILCCPWHRNALAISLLTDREAFHTTGTERWDEMASWRLFNFTSGPTMSWPAAAELMREAHDFYTTHIESAHPAGLRDELCVCCATALRDARVRAVLERHYCLTDDFELFVGHPDEPERNYCVKDASPV
jgi:hypothetical protein